MATSELLRAHVGVIGEAEVGKTALLKAFEKKHYFQQQYIMTQGAQLVVQVVHLDDGRQGERQTDAPSPSTDKPQTEHAVELYLTEVGGHAIFAPLKDRYVSATHPHIHCAVSTPPLSEAPPLTLSHTAHVRLQLIDCPYVLACFDTTRRSTLDTVLQRYQSYKQHLQPNHPAQLALLVGCKSDRRADGEVTADEADEKASEAGMAGYVECSAATGDGVEELFERVAKHVADRHDEHSADKRLERSSDEDEGETRHERMSEQAQPKQSRELSADDSDDD